MSVYVTSSLFSFLVANDVLSFPGHTHSSVYTCQGGGVHRAAGPFSSFFHCRFSPDRFHFWPTCFRLCIHIRNRGRECIGPRAQSSHLFCCCYPSCCRQASALFLLLLLFTSDRPALLFAQLPISRHPHTNKIGEGASTVIPYVHTPLEWGGSVQRA